MTDERYGKNKLGKEYILQDYPLTYDEMGAVLYGFSRWLSALPESRGISAESVPSRMPCLLW